MKKMTQTRPTAALILIAGFVCSVATVFGQTLRVNIKVNSTVGIQQDQPFEVLPEQKSKVGSVNETKQTRTVNALGAFTIQGKEYSNVLVQLSTNGMSASNTKQAVPFNTSLAWHNNTAADANKLQFNDKKSNVFEFSKGPNGIGTKTAQDDDRLAYLYLKVTAEVPADSKAPLEGQIHLTVEY